MDNDPELIFDQEEWFNLAPTEIDARYASRSSETGIRLWALVLSARSIPCRIERDQAGWQLLVQVSRIVEAVAEIRHYEEKNRHWPPPPLLYRSTRDNRLATISVLLLLATFHNITRLKMPLFGHPLPDWSDLGSARVHLIHYGEWWRLVTSLTLHADWLHLLSNLTIGGFFLVALCRELGSGLAWSLLLTAGIFGNWINAQVQLPTHSSVGASTAVFGAVGILAAINLVRHRHDRPFRWHVPVAAALALVALLGTEGKNTDLGAHFFGFLVGGGLGLAAEMLMAARGRPGRALNILLAILNCLVVIVAWLAAISAA